MKLQSVSGALSLGLTLTLTLVLVLADNTDFKSPTVNIYSQIPVEYGVENSLICHTSGFHPPRISITMKKNGIPIEDCTESDLSFARDWTYFKTKHVKFTPQKDDTWECEVQHNEMKPQTYRLEIF